MSLKSELQEFLQKRGCALPVYKPEGNSGPPHCPIFKCSVSVKWKCDELSEMGDGKNKKAAHNSAAENMLRRLMAMEGRVVTKMYSGSQQENCSSPQLLGGALGRRARSISMENDDTDDLYNISFTLSPSRGKSDLQELLQKHHLPLPHYGECLSTGPTHRKVFTAPLEIRSWHDSNRIVWHGHGNGKTKKEAEHDVASKGVQYIRGIIDSDQFHLLEGVERRSPPRDGVEPGTDEYLQLFMANYHSETVLFKEDNEEGREDGAWLCMKQASGGGLDLPVVAHGHGHSEEAAERVATCNLIHSLNCLART